MSWKELLERRGAIVAEARASYDKIDGEDRQPTREEKREFDELIAKAEELSEQIKRANQLEHHEALLAESQGRKTEFVRADSPYDVRVAKPGEIRLLTNTERLSDVYPAKDQGQRDLDLGKVVGLMAGQDVPGAEAEKRALSTTQDSLGGFSVPSAMAREIIDYARNEARIIQAGAQTFQMSSQKVRVPTLDSEAAGQWKPEGAAASEDTTTFGAVEFSSRTLFFWLVISRELWADSALLGPTLKASIAKAAALAIDSAGLMGSGEGEEPRGLYYDSGVTQTAVATGSAYDDLSDAMYRVENANYGPSGIILSPRSQNFLRKLKDGEGNYLPRPAWCPPIHVTKQVPDNLGGAEDESIAVVGDWSFLYIGVRDTFRLEVLKEIKSQQYQVALMGAMRCDVAAVRSAAFEVVTEIKSGWTA